MFSFGCATRSAERIAVSANATATATIESLEDAWGDYVAAGKATLEQEQKVRAAHDRYRLAREAMLQAVIAAKSEPDDSASIDAVDRALSGLAAASASLTSLIQSFLR